MPGLFCPTCGKGMEPNAAFCPNDGTRLNATGVAGASSLPGSQSPVLAKKGGGCAKIVGVVIGLFVLLAIIGSFAGKAPTAPASDADLHSGTQHSAARSSGDHPTQRRPHVVLSISGSGISTTRKFAVSDDWDLAWAYDCSSFGQSGNFIISIEGADTMHPEAGTNQLGPKGDGTEHFHGGAGYRYLEMNSECKWSVKAISL